MPNPKKEEGNEGRCWKCNHTIICVKTGMYNGIPNLKWQNPDGSSHYRKMGDKVACATEGENLEGQPAGYDGFNKPVPKEPFVPKLISEEQQALWNNIVDKAVEYTLLAEERYKNYPQMGNNPAKGGMVTKLAYDMMAHYQKVKEND